MPANHLRRFPSDSVYSDARTATIGSIDTTGTLFLQVTGTLLIAAAANSFTE
jgi:hypothetical protein